MAPPLKVLICGGGCAGPALAIRLTRDVHHVTIVERFPALRATDQQIDLREQGIEVVKRMGLLDAVRSRLVDEAGVSFVESDFFTELSGWFAFFAFLVCSRGSRARRRVAGHCQSIQS